MLRAVAITLAAALLPGCGGVVHAQSFPAGPVGDEAKYGYELITNTRAHLKPYVTSNMDCAACHINGGTQARGGSFVGIAAQFPQWNTRAKRVITLQDRLAECFLYSMNGHPPPYQSKEMIAMVAYITYLSRGTPIGSKPDPQTRLASINFSDSGNVPAGQAIYAQKCSMCHGADGSGSAAFPPLWGPASFNDGAGMHRLTTMAGFVRYNMPQNAPGTLTDRQAYDVAAYVLSHSRPKFDKNAMVAFPAARAGYF
jgi:thiosulfate dehydrogenase